MIPHSTPDIDRFYRTHWRRLCSAAHHRGQDEHEAQDAVQDLFMRLIQQDRLFRVVQQLKPDHQLAFLLTQLHWLLNNRWRKQKCQRRGGGMVFVSLQEESAQRLEPVDHRTPVHFMNAAWVHQIIESALTRLRREIPAATWQALETAVCAGTVTPSKPKSPALRVALHRARQRLQWLITSEVAGATCPQEANAQLLSALH